ncbi:MAG TPA: hypothetical protein VGI39_30325 [Polyangiaceae bacterium]
MNPTMPDVSGNREAVHDVEELDWDEPLEDFALLDPECPTRRGYELAGVMSTQRPPAAYEELRDSCKITTSE